MGEQDRPLAPAALRYSSEESGDFSPIHSKVVLRRRRGVICCGCCAATTLVIGLIMIILAYTVFKVKSPKLTFNTVTIVGLDIAMRQGSVTAPRPGLNMSFVTDISIKNPNAAGFKFANATTQLYYGGVLIGEAWSPRGSVAAQKTVRMNVTIDVMVDTLTRVSRFPRDFLAGQMPVSSYTDVHGRVNVLDIIKKHVDVELNCTMIIALSTQTITEKVCKRTVHL